MLQKQTRVTANDHSGAGWVQLFHIYRGFMRRHAFVGDYVKGSVRRLAFLPKHIRGKRYRPLRVGYKVRGFVAHTRHAQRFADGARCAFTANGVVLLKRRGLFKSKTLYGPLSRAVRKQRYEALFNAFV